MSSAAPPRSSDDGGGAQDPTAPTLLTAPREPINPLVTTQAAVNAAVAALAQGTGSFALDAERAGGFRYTQRAYLLQIRRQGSGTWLIDPTASVDLTPLAEVLTQAEWVLHAANQDLPCLAELGLHPPSLFDTELAGRLLGNARVGLSAMTEQYLGVSLAKEHSAADWSTRPLPSEWLVYAALDVELLLDLRALLEAELVAAGRRDWAQEEFEAVRLADPAPPRPEPWRRVKGVSTRAPGQLAIVRELWLERDRIARQRDKAPGRVLPDTTIAALAAQPPTSFPMLASVNGMKRQPAPTRRVWWEAVQRAQALPKAEWPAPVRNSSEIPHHRVWQRINPLAANRLTAANGALTALAETLAMPRENLLGPRVLRAAIWSLSSTSASAVGPDQELSAQDVSAALRAAGARTWQVNVVGTAIATAILEGDGASPPQITGE